MMYFMNGKVRIRLVYVQLNSDGKSALCYGVNGKRYIISVSRILEK